MPIRGSLQVVPYAVETAVNEQVRPSDAAGYPLHLIVSVAVAVLRNLKSCHQEEHKECPLESEEKFAAVSYLHGSSRGLKKIANRVSGVAACRPPIGWWSSPKLPPMELAIFESAKENIDGRTWHAMSKSCV